MKQIDFQFLTDLCRRIRAVAPNAIIGGGAPRDVFLGGSVKDIDVFVQTTADKFAGLCGDIAFQLKGTIESSQEYVHAPSYNIRIPGLSQELNVVLREDVSPLMDVGDYDFGLSQIACAGFTVIRTAAQIKDVADNTLTYMHAAQDKPEWHVQSSANRMARILQKYPSLQPVNCEKLFKHQADAAAVADFAASL
jgi:hypothetical protein